MTLLDLLELLIDVESLCVVGLVRVGSCSKASRSAATALLAQRAAILLLITVRKAAAACTTCRGNPSKYAAAVTLLLDGAASRQAVVGFLSSPTAAALFVSISHVPLAIATALLTAGLRFSYEQLMQAVRTSACTAGVEAWLQAMDAQPAAVKAALEAGLPRWMREMRRTPDTLVSTLPSITRPLL